MKVFRSLWNDEAGFIVSAELVLVATILVIGMIVGLVTVRNQVVQELVDIGQAIGNISQTYAYGGINKVNVAMTDGASYNDVVDFCQQPAVQANFGAAGGIILDVGLAGVAPNNQERGAVLNP